MQDSSVPLTQNASGSLAQDDSVLLDIEKLKVYFHMEEGLVKAVESVDLRVKRGKTLGIVGESGCGKSVSARAVLQIVSAPGRIESGRIVLHRLIDESRVGASAGGISSGVAANGASRVVEDVVITDLDPTGPEIRAIRGRDIAMVFQEPMSSFSPVHSIGNQIIEAIMLHNEMTEEAARARAIEILMLVGMPEAGLNVDRYPHQLSGGMCQRAMIGMALSCNPSLLIADEPTTALDVTTEAQILDLLRGLQQQLGMAIMYITHNLGVIAQLADEVAVMYLGRVVERAPVDPLYYDPKHPYTRALLRSIPRLGHTADARLDSIEGNVPDPYALPDGCRFHPRCASAIAGRCDRLAPELVDLGGGHIVSCHLYGGRGENSRSANYQSDGEA